MGNIIGNDLNTSQITTYVLEASTIALVSYYILGKSTLDRGVLMLMITIAASHIIMDLFAPKIGLASRQGSGFAIGSNLVGGGMGLQTALGMKRTLKGQVGGMDDKIALDYYGHDRNLSGIESQDGGGMGLQTALGMKRTLAGQGQDGGGMGLQTALGMKLTLKGQVGGMDDKIALDYYGHDRNLSSTDPSSTKQINVLDRFIGDRLALNENSVEYNEIHEKFISNILSDPINNIEPFDSHEIGTTAGERGLVYGHIKADTKQPHTVKQILAQGGK